MRAYVRACVRARACMWQAHLAESLTKEKDALKAELAQLHHVCECPEYPQYPHLVQAHVATI